MSRQQGSMLVTALDIVMEVCACAATLILLLHTGQLLPARAPCLSHASCRNVSNKVFAWVYAQQGAKQAG